MEQGAGSRRVDLGLPAQYTPGPGCLRAGRVGARGWRDAQQGRSCSHPGTMGYHFSCPQQSGRETLKSSDWDKAESLLGPKQPAQDLGDHKGGQVEGLLDEGDVAGLRPAAPALHLLALRPLSTRTVASADGELSFKKISFNSLKSK